jgi:hypothetical protein
VSMGMLRRSGGRHDATCTSADMAHLTLVHGIGNRPERDVLLEQWRVALPDDGVDLNGMGVTCSMVYWADFLCYKLASPGAAHEASEMELEQSVDAEDADFDLVTRGAARGAGLLRASGSRGRARGGDPGAGGGTRSDRAGVSVGGGAAAVLAQVAADAGAAARRPPCRGFLRPRLRNQGGSYAANEAISLPAIEACLRRRPLAPDGPTTDGGPG